MALRSGYYGLKKSMINTLTTLASQLSGMKVIKSFGDGFNLTSAGKLNMTAAAANKMGGVKVGDLLAIIDGVLSVDLPDYSITEFNTGRKWIDGKDIFGKVFVPTSGAITKNTWTDLGAVGIGANTVSDIITLKATIKNATGVYMYPFPDSTVAFKYEKDTDKVMLYCSEDWDNRPAFVILEYTKAEVEPE